ncbi:double-strand break repair helicase AddA [Aliiroseovarius crassostreae]|uniref:DNA 3'-5' helicase n=1 Tax=Aliiroseovarius crassostreae TaxID=154981 RepID=A0A9Q9HBF0_9RHOB|nr:double-strand break repair helicase AddA [Aliiroseovarius crassostreae]UWP95307.1 double-strand break repair helicase AddA [Aliiroseovarius crassostreae]
MFNEATQRQIDAADPGSSTWLSANAGSGKTRVLTDRVARLLLDGVSPQNILCLTYTKAAASEMQNRLFKRLGEWAMKDDDALQNALADLGIPTAAHDLRQARRLFARAIETPGGLKIQTIHAYCAGLLRKFPMEAGVSPQFKEMDDRAAKLLRTEIIDQMAQEQPELVANLARYYTAEDFDGLAADITHNRSHFLTNISESDIRKWFDIPATLTEQQVLDRAFAPGDGLVLERLLPLLNPDNRNDAASARKLAAILPLKASIQSLIQLETLFLSEKGAGAGRPKKTFPSAAVKKDTGKNLMPHLEQMMERVADTKPLRSGLYSALKTTALHRFATWFVAHYELAKQQRGWLDFDDLIVKAGDLLTDPAVAAWILYRLDGGIDHILVDEAQDTSPAQWRVIDNLSREFTSGLGARDDVNRTIFVVGDPKQSIYSFQGARPDKFEEMRDNFRDKLGQIGKPFQDLPMEFSFRSSPAILQFVDHALHDQGGLGDAFKHRAFFDKPGRVDLWPVIEPVKFEETRDWFDPIDKLGEEDHRIQLARKIAREIKRIIETESLPAENGESRPVHAGDFLVLLRKRSDLFHEIIRACKQEGLPIAGADRLRIGGELAVKDLKALLSFLATPEDDLSLACVLRSPLAGLSEQDLFRLAHPRGKNTYLWRALRDQREHFPTLVQMLTELRDDADFLRPYELIERVLTRFNGRSKLLARLGQEAEDGIDALLAQALAYERLETPSLTGFVNWLEVEEVTIKRQMDTVDQQIRVMTVHGSKGLEAPIVILPDLARSQYRNRDELVELDGGHAIWKPSTTDRTTAVEAALARDRQAQEEEATRLLYVAMTRAEQWLILAATGTIGKAPTEWYNIATEAMERAGGTIVDLGENSFRRFELGLWPAQAAAQTKPAPQTEVSDSLPKWAAEPAKLPIEELALVSPSDLGGAKAIFDPNQAELDEESAKRRGRQIHLLLEHLPSYAPSLWSEYAQTLLSTGDDSAPPEDIAEILKEARGVLTSAELAHIFTPDTLAEVEVTAPLPGYDRMLYGIIDRLIVAEHTVTVVDFKSNRVVPASAADTPEGVLRQMAAYRAALLQIYPQHSIEAAILWTHHAKLMPLDPNLLEEAYRRLDVGGAAP